MRLLVFTPTWRDAQGNLAMRPECAAAVGRQQLAEGDRLEWRVSTENPYPIPDFRNVLHQYQRARAMCLSEGYDALLTVEHDNALSDAGIVRRMVETLQATSLPCDVVYAPYALRHGAKVLNVWQYNGERNLGESLTLHPEELERACRAATWRVSGVGFGCTLIPRRVLEQFEFRPNHNVCPDTPFAEDCLRAGLTALAQMDAPIWHYAEGEWLHPYKEARMKYKANQSLNVLVEGHVVMLVAGEIVEMSEAAAFDLIRGGYVSGPIGEGAIEQAVLELPEVADAPAQAAPVKRRPRSSTVH